MSTNKNDAEFRWQVPFLVVFFAISLALLFINSLQRAADPDFPPYQPTAIIGNGRLLVTVSSRGTITDLFWPQVGLYQNIHNPHTWLYEPGRTPSHTGMFLGVQDDRGNVHWLRDYRVTDQRYHRDTNVLITSWQLPGGISITVEDWVDPDRDVLLRWVRSTGPHKRRLRVVSFQNLTLGGTPDNNTISADGRLMLHSRTQPRIAVSYGASQPPDSIHTGSPETLTQVSRGRFNSVLHGEGDIASALAWDLEEDLLIVYSFATEPARAAFVAREYLGVRPDLLKARAVNSDQNWLQSDKPLQIPDPEFQDLYNRSLLVLKLLQDSRTGAIIAGARSYWQYCWPRDSVFAAAAFDLAGYPGHSRLLYNFLARCRNDSEGWAARYYPDHRPVDDGRASQIDAPGFLLWGLWLHFQLYPDTEFLSSAETSIDLAVSDILSYYSDELNLVGPSSDYWESSRHLDFYLSNAIISATGLTAAAYFYDFWGDTNASETIKTYAKMITEKGVPENLWNDQNQSYRRALEGFPGVDTAVCWAVSPFGISSPDDEKIQNTIRRMEKEITTPIGGLTPGEDWKSPDPWVPETVFALLYWLAAGDLEKADEYFNWVASSASSTGTLPEIVSVRTGLPASTLPLGWSHSLFILAAHERWGGGIPGVAPLVSTPEAQQ